MAESNPAQLEQELIEAEMERKAEELQALSELRRAGGFAPRTSLARTPPQGFATPMSEHLLDQPISSPSDELFPQPGDKRSAMLTSPEDVQAAVRRRVNERKVARDGMPPIGGLLSRPASPAATPRQPQAQVDQLADAPLEQLAGMATASTQGIMEAVRSKSSKLNKDEMAAIGVHTERLLAVVTHLTLRLATAERAAQRLPVAEPAAPTPLSFANALRLGKTTAPVPIVPPPGPAVAIYPAEDQRGVIKTADDTRRTLLDAVHPGRLGLQIAGVRKVSNTGVIIHTASAAAADTRTCRTKIDRRNKLRQPWLTGDRCRLRVGQLNLQGSAVATAGLPRIAEEEALDVILDGSI
ncbi:hypothetical protein B5X24_HaOG208503 [Helicoverpa armigera]|uniref:Uncharacterized protein n=1 Tax=Helicoverpa armigera TaxID=29058 RepID=A0A2W1BI25_HELAM|nr:hypothetical protein B5X24_HaOG208503 [Helicoverpa armigera]